MHFKFYPVQLPFIHINFAASGLKYRVTPFETVMEGTYDEVMEVVKKAQQACYDAGAESMMTYIKIQSSKDTDVSIEDKMEKYDK